MNILDFLLKDLRNFSDIKRRDIFLRFFKTKKGEYGYGDMFWGITVPNIRKVAKKYYKKISFEEIKVLINNEIHEVRLTGYLILTYIFENSNSKRKKDIVNFYLTNLNGVNNWDIVDLSCYKILGRSIYEGILKRDILLKLAKSKNIWERRISIVSTYYLIKMKEYDVTLDISKILIKDEHGLIKKAVGWMLREVGKRDINLLREFLNENIKDISRVTLRYSIERMEKGERDKYLSLR